MFSVMRSVSTTLECAAAQSKSLPRYEDNPWLPSFIFPLFSYNTSKLCNKISTEILAAPLVSGKSICVGATTFDLAPDLMCASCHVKKIQLKRCKKVSYCSINCQKNHSDMQSHQNDWCSELKGQIPLKEQNPLKITS